MAVGAGFKPALATPDQKHSSILFYCYASRPDVDWSHQGP
jgi:hypothetical protein